MTQIKPGGPEPIRAESAQPAPTRPEPTRPEPIRVWIGGEVFDDPTKATVGATDHGLVVGDGVFEALKVTAGRPFALRRHLARMDRSAEAMGLPKPDHDLIRRAIEDILDGFEVGLGRIRITYTGGSGPLSSQAAYGPQTLVVAVSPIDPPAVTTAIVTAPWSRNEHGALAGVKSTSYAENVRALAYANQRGASEAILLNTAGNVCEGTGTNIFAVFGNEVVTPPLSSGPLAGVTRDVLLEWCRVSEADFTLAEARNADEVFITSSVRDVQAVHRWDEIDFEAPGPRTSELATIFTHHSSDDLDP